MGVFIQSRLSQGAGKFSWRGDESNSGGLEGSVKTVVVSTLAFMLFGALLTAFLLMSTETAGDRDLANSVGQPIQERFGEFVDEHGEGLTLDSVHAYVGFFKKVFIRIYVSGEGKNADWQPVLEKWVGHVTKDIVKEEWDIDVKIVKKTPDQVPETDKYLGPLSK